METNAFKCPKCKKVTKHIRMSQAEVVAITGSGNLGRLFGEAFDYSGLDKLCGAITGIKSWKCTECAKAASRKADGTILEEWN